jgi:hypothetical protein
MPALSSLMCLNSQTLHPKCVALNWFWIARLLGVVCLVGIVVDARLLGWVAQMLSEDSEHIVDRQNRCAWSLPCTLHSLISQQGL